MKTMILTVLFLKRPYKKLLKAKFLDVYKSKSHKEYYNFCQQYIDHFTIAKANGSNCVFFAMFFL